MGEFATLLPLHLGVRQSLWLLGDTETSRVVSLYPPYYAAVQELREIFTFTSPFQKLQCLKQTIRAIHFSVVDYYERLNMDVNYNTLVM